MEKNLSFPWTDKLDVLSKIAKIDPQGAYTCFFKDYKRKFNYYMRTIPHIYCEKLSKLF